MVQDPRFNIDSTIFAEARRYVERQRVTFFDFYRNSAFGFVQVTREGRGYYPMVMVGADGELEANCNCRKHAYGRVCAHAFALYLKLRHWPNEDMDLSKAFDSFFLLQFLLALPKSERPSVIPEALSFNPGEAGINPRMLAYLGLIPAQQESQRNRDQRCLQQAKDRLRTDQEKAMLARGMGSNQLTFEESDHYGLCKYLFSIHQRSGLQIRAQTNADHQVVLTLHGEGRELLVWQLPVMAYRKAITSNWALWPTHFGLRRQSLPIQYSMVFNSNSDLVVEPVLLVADTMVALTAIQEVGRGIYHHDQLGYFSIQTGLSAFEMQFSEPGIHVVNHQEVRQFLKQHRETLDSLDRTHIAEEIFGEVVVEQLTHYKLQLLSYAENAFVFQLAGELGEQSFTHQDLSQLLCHGVGRYRKLGGKLFDTAGYDGAFLEGIFHGDAASDRLVIGDLFRLMVIFAGRLEVHTNQETKSIYDQLENFSAPDPPSLEGSQLSLRPYQTLGYQWLHFLAHFNLGGLLCDQMGLGKTHQAMALIHAVLAQQPEGRVIVVTPASVLFHWRNMLQRFCPRLSSVIHMGADRNLVVNLRKAQVLLSSYHTLRNDAPQLSGQPVALVIFDEIQYLKNRDTKMHQALAQVRAACKVGLTGTPIENDVEELKNLLDLVFPGYLGTHRHFRRFFLDPIVKRRKTGEAAKLRELIKPFVLRRVKTQVLQDLPEKTEDTRLLKLGDYERELYQFVKQQGYGKIFDGEGKPVFVHVFQLIDQLKRVCNHPALYFENPDYTTFPSAKWETFKELLHEALDSGEKVVVFTHYLGMIDIFQNHLNACEVGYATITGATRDREAQQQRFMNDPSCRVFLGSLMAAGVGIDLTAASILIHYDRWWNPAREEQATDRIHRIGQKKNVQIYKFKTLETVEERIHRTIERKRHLLEEVVGFDSEQVAKSLNVKELMELLS